MPTSRSKAAASASTTTDAEDFSFSTAPLYAEKDEYVEKALTFTILAIDFEQSTGYEGQDRWSVRVAPSDGRPEELITLGCNEKRDEQMRSAQVFIERKGPIKDVRLKRSGKTYYFENASQRTTH